MLFLDVLHQAVDRVLGLKSLLLDRSMLLAFHFEDCELVLESLVVLGRLDLERKEVLLHAPQDVVVRCLRELLFIYLFLSVVKGFFEHC